MKEAVTKVIDTLALEDFHGALQKLLERYNKCIATGEDYLKWDKSFMCVLSIKVPIRKKSGNLFHDPRNYNNHHYKHTSLSISLNNHKSYSSQRFSKKFVMEIFSSLLNDLDWRCPWCNGYRHGNGHGDTSSNPGREWLHFHIALIPSGKVLIQLFSLQLWVNSRAD